MDKNVYKTKQKEAIHSFIAKNHETHFTALVLTQELKEAGFAVSAATVYRHLDKLVKEGLVNKYVVDNKNSAIYEYAGSRLNDCSQFHFKCDDCGKLIHVECNFVSDMKSHLLNDHNFNLDITKTVFYGQCTECSK